MVSGTANIGGAEALELLGGRRRRATATSSRRPPRPRCSRRTRSASTTSPATCPSGSTTSISRTCLRAPSPIRSARTTARATRIRGSNWRTVTTGELRFPWREGAHRSERCHRFPRRALRRGGVGAGHASHRRHRVRGQPRRRRRHRRDHRLSEFSAAHRSGHDQHRPRDATGADARARDALGSTPAPAGGAKPATPAECAEAPPPGGASAPAPGAAAPAAEGANPDEPDKDPYEGIAPEELPPDLQYNADSSVSFPTNI